MHGGVDACPIDGLNLTFFLPISPFSPGALEEGDAGATIGIRNDSSAHRRQYAGQNRHHLHHCRCLTRGVGRPHALDGLDHQSRHASASNDIQCSPELAAHADTTNW